MPIRDDSQPTVPVYAGFTPAETRMALRRKLEPSYQGTFMGARKYVLHTFATTQSALMKKRVSQFLIGSPCSVCGGRRLKREALAIKFAGVDIGTLSALPLNRVAELLAPAAAGQLPEPESPERATRKPACGPPQKVCEAADSRTSPYLRRLLRQS